VSVQSANVLGSNGRRPSMTITLRLVTGDVIVVTERWWRKFLLSQEQAFAAQKKPLTSTRTTGVDSSHGPKVIQQGTYDSNDRPIQV
jgi:hypothetical protein